MGEGLIDIVAGGASSARGSGLVMLYGSKFEKVRIILIGNILAGLCLDLGHLCFDDSKGRDRSNSILSELVWAGTRLSSKRIPRLVWR